VVGTSKGKGYRAVVKRHGFRAAGRPTVRCSIARRARSAARPIRPRLPRHALGGPHGRRARHRQEPPRVKVDEEKDLIYLRGRRAGRAERLRGDQRAKRGLRRGAGSHEDRGQELREHDGPGSWISRRTSSLSLQGALSTLWSRRTRGPPAPGRTRPRCGARSPARARSSGSRRARAGRAWVPCAAPIWRHGGTVHGRSPATTRRTSRRARRERAQVRALAQAQGVSGDRARQPRGADPQDPELVSLLTRLGAEGKVLLVDRKDNENLTLASRTTPGSRPSTRWRSSLRRGGSPGWW